MSTGNGTHSRRISVEPSFFGQSTWLPGFVNPVVEQQFLAWRSDSLLKYERLLHTLVTPLWLLGSVLRLPWDQGRLPDEAWPHAVIAALALLHCVRLWRYSHWYARWREPVCLAAWFVHFAYFWRHAQPALLQCLSRDTALGSPARFSWAVGAEPNLLVPLSYIIRVRMHLPLALLLALASLPHTRALCTQVPSLAAAAVGHGIWGGQAASSCSPTTASSASSSGGSVLDMAPGSAAEGQAAMGGCSWAGGPSLNGDGGSGSHLPAGCISRALKLTVTSILFPLLVNYFLEVTSRSNFVQAMSAPPRRNSGSAYGGPGLVAANAMYRSSSIGPVISGNAAYTSSSGGYTRGGAATDGAGEY